MHGICVFTWTTFTLIEGLGGIKLTFTSVLMKPKIFGILSTSKGLQQQNGKCTLKYKCTHYISNNSFTFYRRNSLEIVCFWAINANPIGTRTLFNTVSMKMAFTFWAYKIRVGQCTIPTINIRLWCGFIQFNWFRRLLWEKIGNKMSAWQQTGLIKNRTYRFEFWLKIIWVHLFIVLP